ncbi:very short patch repair endonuclease [Dietzia cercidiphylli]|nr:very short patch repair endonuclease [Dietzia cercidiphylli]
MKKQKRKDTKCELAVRRQLHRSGVRFRVDFRPLPDQLFRVDVGWKGRKVAVFIDGCFWHGCPEHGSLPKSNSNWWAAKLDGNRARDRRADSALRTAGWTVLRFWEHENPESVAKVIVATLRSGQPTKSASPSQTY